MNLAYLVTAGPASSSHYSTASASNTSSPTQISLPPRPNSNMATALHPNPYSSHSMGYTYQRPPSPPEEENKCSLPSISSLLQAAEADRTSQGLAHFQQSQPTSTPKSHPTQLEDAHSKRYSLQAGQKYMTTEHQRSQSLGYGPESVSQHRVHLPPSPPQESESHFDGHEQSNSVSSTASTPYSTSAINNLEPYQQRQVSHISQSAQRPVHGSPSTYNGSAYTSPSAATTSSSGMYYQRPLPTNFSPTTPMTVGPVGHPPSISHGSPAWQHHHYFPPSSSTGYAQNQDRYVCQTCNKAFSRPSSLRIHSHSHTGEKPFRCSHNGCGKAFSVRSNMKRHERGCHTGLGDGSMSH